MNDAIAGQAIDLIAFEAHLERWLRGFDGDSPTYAMLRYHFGLDGTHLRRGKRLRPHLTMLVAAAEGSAPDVAYDAAAAIEILHNYSLVHDDIEDRDAMRHGRPTVWKQYGDAHGINTGDAMCALSYLALLNNEAGHPPERVMTMNRILHEANLAMCAGQGLDISFESASAVTLDEYFCMIEGKTGALFGASCALGAISAGASHERVEAYRAMGRAYGLAFQIRDDILGIWGAPHETGKPAGGDIARRKWTFPIAWTLQHGGGPERKLVAQAYAGGAPLGEVAAQAVIRALGDVGAREAAQAVCDELMATVERSADQAAVDRERAVRLFFAKGTRLNV